MAQERASSAIIRGLSLACLDDKIMEVCMTKQVVGGVFK